MSNIDTLVSRGRELQRLLAAFRNEANGHQPENVSAVQTAVENATMALRSVTTCYKSGSNLEAVTSAVQASVKLLFQSGAELLCNVQGCLVLDHGPKCRYGTVLFPERLIQALLILALELETAYIQLKPCRNAGTAENLSISSSESMAGLEMQRCIAKTIVGLFGLHSCVPLLLTCTSSNQRTNKPVVASSEMESPPHAIDTELRRGTWRSAVLRAESLLAVLCGSPLCGHTTLGDRTILMSNIADGSAPTTGEQTPASLDVFFESTTEVGTASIDSDVHVCSRDLQQVVLETLRRFENSLRSIGNARERAVEHLRRSVDMHAIRFVMLFIDVVSAASRDKNATSVTEADSTSTSDHALHAAASGTHLPPASSSQACGGKLVDATDQVDFMGEVASVAEVLLLPTMHKTILLVAGATEHTDLSAFHRLMTAYSDILHRIVQRQRRALRSSDCTTQKTSGVAPRYDQLVEDTDRIVGVRARDGPTDSVSAPQAMGHSTASLKVSTCIPQEPVSAKDVRDTLRALKANRESERLNLHTELSKAKELVVTLGNSVLEDKLKNDKLRAVCAQLQRVQSEPDSAADLNIFLRECLTLL